MSDVGVLAQARSKCLANNLELLAMKPAHLEQVAAIHNQINPSPWSLAQWQSCCEQPNYANWVADKSGEVVAFVCSILIGPEMELLNIGVSQSQQGRGVGEDLLRATLLLAPEKVEKCFLEVRRSNLPAIGLYKKLGFEQIAERKNYYRLSSGVVEDALIFSKVL